MSGVDKYTNMCRLVYMSSNRKMTSTKVRAGMYRVTISDFDIYHVIETEFSDGWYWTVQAYGELTSEIDLGLFRTKRDAMAALAAQSGIL